MKQFLKYISFSLVLAIGFTSCDADDENQLDDVRDLGGYAHLTTTTISQFDVDSDLNIDLFTANGVTVETVEIISDGAVIETADIDGETASFSSSVFGELEPDDTFPIRVRATLSNGNTAEQPFTVTVVESLTINADSEEVATLTGIDTIAVVYNTYNLAATIDNVEMHIKNGSEGTYIDSGISEFTCTAANRCTVEFGDTNYQELNLAVNDTLYYRFTATSGTLTQDAEDYIVIVEEPEDEDDGDDNGETDGDTDEDDGDDNGDTDEDDGDDNGETDGDTDEDDGDDNGDTTDGDTDEDDGDDNGETDGDTDEDDGEDNGDTTDGDTDEDDGEDNGDEDDDDDDTTEGDDD